MSILKDQLEYFLAALGNRMVELGFPAKLSRKTYFFQQKTPAGFIGVHINDRLFPAVEGYVTVKAAASIKTVQDILVRTELYAPVSGLTWTFGCHLYDLRNEGKFIPNIPSIRHPDGTIESKISDVLAHTRRYGSPRYEFTEMDSRATIAALAQEVFGHVKEFAWPFLQMYGSEEGALALTLRTDDLAESCFLDPEKPLTGLILARHLGRADAVPKLFANARKRYAGFAAHGNPEPSERFERLARELGFVCPPDRPAFSRVLGWLGKLD
jgi:hypothetical protein